MSAARKAFCDRIGSVRGAIGNFNLRDLPAIPANAAHNDSVRIIRNGLAVQCFNILEDFIKARTAELLDGVSTSGLPFQYLPERFQWATTVDAVRAIDYQLKLRERADRILYAQDYTAKISSSKTGPLDLAETAFFHAASNIAGDHVREAMNAFAVSDPWKQCSALASRLGLSGIPADAVFQSLAQRRHNAAHNASASVSELDLQQSLSDAAALAICFDILSSRAMFGICKLKAAHPKGSWIINDQALIPLRFIKHSKNRFCEIKEKGTRSVRVHVDALHLVPAATTRTKREGGALLVYDAGGFPITWFVE
jgi:hypothetical protein